MAEIHPTAIVDEAAELADDCVVGPYCVIGAGVRIGPACQLDSHVVITGRTTLGRGNHLFSHAALGGAPQDLKYEGEDTTLTVGDHNEIREFVTMHVGTANGDGCTTVGDHNLLMVGAHIAHDSHIGNHCVLANNVLLAGHITIDDFAVVSGGTAIHHFVTIGRYAFIGGNSGIVHDAPPFMVSDGHPARVRGVNLIGLHRHEFDEQAIENLKYAYRLLYKREQGNQNGAIDALQAELADDRCIGELCEFARRAASGVHGRHRETDRRDDKREAAPRAVPLAPAEPGPDPQRGDGSPGI